MNKHFDHTWKMTLNGTQLNKQRLQVIKYLRYSEVKPELSSPESCVLYTKFFAVIYFIFYLFFKIFFKFFCKNAYWNYVTTFYLSNGSISHFFVHTSHIKNHKPHLQSVNHMVSFQQIMHLSFLANPYTGSWSFKWKSTSLLKNAYASFRLFIYCIC